VAAAINFCLIGQFFQSYARSGQVPTSELLRIIN